MHAKILCLIIDSVPHAEWTETYQVHRRIWHRCLDRCPWVDGYFLYSDPALPTNHVVGLRRFKVRSEERIDTILDKTIVAIEELLRDDHAYVIRTNNSSLWDFPLLAQEKLPSTGLYRGHVIPRWSCGHFVTGSGMIMSRDVAKMLAKAPRDGLEAHDDVAIAQILRRHGVGAQHRPWFCYDYAQGPDQLRTGHLVHYRLRDNDDPQRKKEREVTTALFDKLYPAPLEGTAGDTSPSVTTGNKSAHPSFGLPPTARQEGDALVRQLLQDHPVAIAATSPSKAYHVLMELRRVLAAGVPGHVVELGCYQGETTTLMRRLLDAWGEGHREIHVYDSWEGLPAPAAQDTPVPGVLGFPRGGLASPRSVFEARFAQEQLPLPHVHSGWFANIPDAEYPAPVAFAFFDGDLYPSIIDSFAKVYPKLSPGARVVIDDYNWDRLPGVKRACEDFLRDKPERERELPDYYGPGLGGGALMIKS